MRKMGKIRQGGEQAAAAMGASKLLGMVMLLTGILVITAAVLAFG